jgi:tRNA dimethylallyltransferase
LAAVSDQPIYVYILGPTATGKTELSLRLAEKTGWPIINCDSVQVYKDVNIGTAKPSAEELSRAEHFLFDYVEPPHKQTAAEYLDHVVDCLRLNNFINAIFVGGSGFYVQALEKGLYPESQTSAAIKQEIDQWITDKGYTDLYRWIQDKDSQFAKKISENDHYRLRRAVEVMKSQSLNMTELKKQMAEQNHSPLPEHQSIKVGMSDERSSLRMRVERRTQKMLEQGLIEEVQALRQRGLKDWAPMQSVGYKEVQMHLENQIPKGELQERITTATMQLIKKQQTWFKRDPDIHWFKPHEIMEAMSWLAESID